MPNMIMQSASSPHRCIFVGRFFGPSAMSCGSLPIASFPRPTDNVEVLSQRVPSRGEAVLEAPQDDLPDPGRKVSKTPTGSKFGPQPNTTPEPPVVPDSGRQPPVKRGKPPVPVTSVHPEEPDNLLEALPSMKSTALS